MTIDDDFLSQFPSMHDKTTRLGVVVPMHKSVERCKREMQVLEAEEYMHSRDRHEDAAQAIYHGEVLVQRRTKDGELKTYNPLHAKNLKSQRRIST